MKSRSIIIGVVASIILLAGAAALYWAAGKSGEDERNYRVSLSLIQQMHQLAANWSIEAARVKSDPLADFDALAAFIPRLARLRSELANTVLHIPDMPDRLSNDISVYLHALDGREERIERFKTGYAVIRNSTRYLPLAATGVVQQAQDVDDVAVMRAVSNLTQELNSYLATPSDLSKDRLVMGLQNLRDASIVHPPALANAVTNFIAHAQVLLERQVPTEEIFRDLTSSDVSELTEALIRKLEFELDRNEELTTWYEFGTITALVALLLLWIEFALRRARRGPVEVPVAAAAAGGASPPVSVVPEGGQPLPPPVVAEEVAAPPPAAAPAEKAPVHLSAESVLMHRITAGVVASNLSASTHRISTSMDILDQIQDKILSASERGDGIRLGEEIEAASTVVANVRSHAKQLAAMARSLTASSKQDQEIKYDMLDVNACVEEVIEATGANAAASIMKDLGATPEIFGSKTEIRLILANVIENSAAAIREANRKNGIIRIETSRKDGNALITVTDNGAGVEPERRREMFNPFYTSRKEGTGMGLTSTNYLVKKYEGTISVSSLPGQGTVLRIMLPAGVPGP